MAIYVYIVSYSYLCIYSYTSLNTLYCGGEPEKH